MHTKDGLTQFLPNGSSWRQITFGLAGRPHLRLLQVVPADLRPGSQPVCVLLLGEMEQALRHCLSRRIDKAINNKQIPRPDPAATPGAGPRWHLDARAAASHTGGRPFPRNHRLVGAGLCHPLFPAAQEKVRSCMSQRTLSDGQAGETEVPPVGPHAGSYDRANATVPRAPGPADPDANERRRHSLAEFICAAFDQQIARIKALLAENSSRSPNRKEVINSLT